MWLGRRQRNERSWGTVWEGQDGPELLTGSLEAFAVK